MHLKTVVALDFGKSYGRETEASPFHELPVSKATLVTSVLWRFGIHRQTRFRRVSWKQE